MKLRRSERASKCLEPLQDLNENETLGLGWDKRTDLMLLGDIAYFVWRGKNR